jgi:hypothetical protein
MDLSTNILQVEQQNNLDDLQQPNGLLGLFSLFEAKYLFVRKSGRRPSPGLIIIVTLIKS